MQTPSKRELTPLRAGMYPRAISVSYTPIILLNVKPTIKNQ